MIDQTINNGFLIPENIRGKKRGNVILFSYRYKKQYY